MDGALRPKQHRLDGLGVRDTDPDRFFAFNSVSRSRGGLGSRYILWGSVPDSDFMSGFNKVRRHGAAHDSQAKEGYAHRHALKISGVMASSPAGPKRRL